LLLQSAAKPKPAKCGGGLDCIGDGNWHFCNAFVLKAMKNKENERKRWRRKSASDGITDRDGDDAPDPASCQKLRTDLATASSSHARQLRM
jgi:hypothetical protein